MPISKADAEALRDAIQGLITAFNVRPNSKSEREELFADYQTIERLTNDPFPVPGEDAAAWSLRFRTSAWKVYKSAVGGPPAPAEEVTHLKHCQDLLRTLPGLKPANATAPPAAGPKEGGAAAIPQSLRDWIVKKYLADPIPSLCKLEPNSEEEPMVFVPWEGFADHIIGAGLALVPTLKALTRLGWIEDIRVEVKEVADLNKSLPHCFERLNLPDGEHRLVGIRQAVLDAAAAAAHPTVLTPDITDKPPADPFAELRQFARDKLKGQGRAVIEALCDAGGELPLADIKALCDWQDPIDDAWNSLRKRLNGKISALSRKLVTHDRKARLESAE